MILIAILTGSILVASLGTMTILYKLKDKDYQIATGQVSELVVQKKAISDELEGLNQQLKDERARHAQLESDLKQTQLDYILRQKELEEKKRNQATKGDAKKNPKAYELESQKALDNYINRMNCISGNVTSCSKS